jgi:hypothetical protein
MGVVFARMGDEDLIIGLARNTERNLESNSDDSSETEEVDAPVEKE